MKTGNLALGFLGGRQKERGEATSGMSKANLVLRWGQVLTVVGLVAWGLQLKNGLFITGLRNPFAWGLYIATFAFFVGTAAGGLIISSAVYLFNLKTLKPFTRLASLSAFASIVAATAAVLVDLGRADRFYQLFFHPNFRSPLIWDVLVVGTYVILTFLSVYFQLLPIGAKEGGRFPFAWATSLPREQVEEISRRWTRRVALVGLPVAILIHTITALIFATQASRAWWNTAVLPPDFIAVAVASGTALVLIMALFTIDRHRFSEYQGAFRLLAKIIGGALLVHFFFMYNDLLIHWWWGKEEAAGTLALVFGRYLPLHLTEVVLPLAALLYFLSRDGARSVGALVLGATAVFVGVFAHRLLLMYPAQNRFPLSLALPGKTGFWNYPIAVGQFRPGEPVFAAFWTYLPTLPEMAVDLLPFGLLLLISGWFIASYPFLGESS